MLEGVALLPPSFPPSRTQAFYIIKRQNCLNICNRVYFNRNSVIIHSPCPKTNSNVLSLVCVKHCNSLQLSGCNQRVILQSRNNNQASLSPTMEQRLMIASQDKWGKANSFQTNFSRKRAIFRSKWSNFQNCVQPVSALVQGVSA